MLKEITTVKQIQEEPKHRWFSNDSLDLYIWYDINDRIIQFQICYDKGTYEKALTWKENKKLSHHSVDDGEGGVFRMKSTPILVPDGEFDKEKILKLFAELGAKLEHEMFEFVRDHILTN